MLVQAPADGNPGRNRPALVATVVSAALTVLKGGVWALTGSASMLASALDSLGDVVVSALNALALRAAARPADQDHPYGHGKIEHLAGLFQGLLMVGTAAWVVVEALRRLDRGESLAHRGVGIAATVVSMAVAWLLASWLRRRGEALRSPALVADSRHYATDYLTNLGVLAAFAADAWFDYPAADPVISIVIAAAILRGAGRLLLDAAQALMDHELSSDELRSIQHAIMAFSPPVRGFHDLMTRRAGPDRFVQCHIEIDAALSFREAHECVEAIREAIEKRLPGALVTLHADPWPENDAGRDPHRRPVTDAGAASGRRLE